MKVILSSKLILRDVQLAKLQELLGKNELRDVKVLVIADAASRVDGAIPEWAYGDAEKFKSLGAEVALCNLSESGASDLEQQILESDVLFFEGGSTPKLLKVIKDSGIMELINSKVCDDKIWFGISAGGCVLSKKCYSSCEKWFVENPMEEPVEGLCGDGDIVFIPHFRSKDFELNTEENLKFVKAKLDNLRAIVGTDECAVTGVLENGIFIPSRDMYEACLMV